MWRWVVLSNAWEEEIWSCSWCCAATHVGGECFEIALSPYVPMDMRWEWERAVAGGTSGRY